MSEHTAPAVANEFVRLNEGFLPQKKLQKLSYIAHGWSLAVFDDPLIREQPEAWAAGPVYRKIWDRIRDNGFDRRGFILSNSKKPFLSAMSDNDLSVISHVWKRYRRYDSDELSGMTHQPGTPWTKIYFSQGQNTPIPNHLIRGHYRELAFAGRSKN